MKKSKENDNHVTDFEITNYRLSNIENNIYHDSFQKEEALMQMISSGDNRAIDIMRDSIVSSIKGKGTMSYSQLQQEEYSAVIGISLFARAAIRGGVDQYRCYDLNDLFLQRIGEASSIEDYQQITLDALIRFVKEVQKHQSIKHSSKYISQVKQCIALNLNKNISLSEIAQQVGLSPTYLSGLFSKVEKMPIKEYYAREKVYAAKNMLHYSNYSVQEIADYLNFASASHFDRTFKKYVGITPSQFRSRQME